MSFSPSSNTTSNFRQRVEAMQLLLRREGLDTTEQYTPITKLFGYSMAVGEETLTGVVKEVAKQNRLDVVEALLDFLSSHELGRVGIILVQNGLFDAIVPLAPKLPPHQLSSLVSSCLRSQYDDVFDVLKPFLTPSLATSTSICSAAANQAPKFGNYFIEHGDVLDALRAIQTPSVAQQVAKWWAAAIAEQRVPVPDLGRSASHWRKKFPELSVVLRASKMDEVLPEPVPVRTSKFRF